MPIDYIVVIGASGFLGSAFVRFYKQQPNTRIILVTRQTYDYYKVYIEAYQIIPKYTIWCAGISSKVYCNENESYCWEQNVENLMRAIDDFPCETFIYISSLDVYPENWNKNDKYEDMYVDPNTLSSYGRFKLEGESLVKKNSNNYLIVRGNGFTGIGLKKNVVFDLNQPERNIWVGIKSEFQFVHTDVFTSVVNYLCKNYVNNIFNVSSLSSITVEQIAHVFGIPLTEIKYPPHSNRIAIFNTYKLESVLTPQYKKYLSPYIAINFWDRDCELV